VGNDSCTLIYDSSRELLGRADSSDVFFSCSSGFGVNAAQRTWVESSLLLSRELCSLVRACWTMDLDAELLMVRIFKLRNSDFLLIYDHIEAGYMLEYTVELAGIYVVSAVSISLMFGAVSIV